MLIFGHAGITLGIAVLLAGATTPHSEPRRGVRANSRQPSADSEQSPPHGLLRRYASRNDGGAEGFRDSCLFRISRFVFRASSPSSRALNGLRYGTTARLHSLAKRIDLRLLFIASLLPDIIDKPTGHLPPISFSTKCGVLRARYCGPAMVSFSIESTSPTGFPACCTPWLPTPASSSPSWPERPSSRGWPSS